MENDDIIEIEETMDSTENTVIDDRSEDDIYNDENEEITLEEITDSPSEGDSVPEFAPDPNDRNDTLEDLLRNYFLKSSNSELEENIESNDDNIASNEASSESSSDYTLLLEEILQSSHDSYDTIDNLYTAYDQYMDNNSLDSSVDDISLNNTLLLVLIIVLMFNGVLDFARRIF